MANFKKGLMVFLFFLFAVCVSLQSVNAATLTSLTINGSSVYYRGTSTRVQIPSTYDKQKFDMRAVWISAFAGDVSINGETQFKTAMNTAIDTMKYYNMNTMVFHVRTHNDAFYPSALNPKSSYVSNINFTSFDPVEWLVDRCHAEGIEFHAWMNPYRVKTSYVYSSVNPASSTSNLLTGSAVTILDPGKPNVRQFLYDTVAEFLNKYDVDAIHFDDYFYADGISDTATYNAYNPSGLALADWRRAQVDTFIQTLSSQIRSFNTANNKCVQLGISPTGIYRNGGSYSVAMNGTYDSNGTYSSIGSNTSGQEHYASYLYSNTKKWVDNEWLDYITPQSYWAFTHPTAGYADVMDWWAKVVAQKDVNLYSGIGLYMADSTSETYSWKTHYYEAAMQVRYINKWSQIQGSCIYSYKYLLNAKNGGTTYASYNANNLRTLWNYKSLTPPVRTANAMTLGSVPGFASSGNTLAWSLLNGARKYAIYRSTTGTIDSSINQLIAVVGDTTTSYVDTTAITGTTYTYGIRAISRTNHEGTLTLSSQVTPSSVSISGSSSVPQGSTIQLSAIVYPSGAVQTVNWSSSNNNVLTVNSSGVVTGVSAGTATVTAAVASNSSITSSKTITVTSAVPTAVTITGAPSSNPLLAIGATLNLSASVTPSSASQSITWTSSNTSVATISSSGVLNTVGAGNALIKATAINGVYSSISVDVYVSTPTSVIINSPSNRINKGESITLTATVLPSTASQNVIWSSSNTSVANISSGGVLTALNTGNVIITCRATDLGSGGTIISATYAIEIAYDGPTSIGISGDSSVLRGSTISLSATVYPLGASQSVLWTSSNPSVATVNSSGVVSGLSTGTTTIQATSILDAGVYATKTITVVYYAPTSVVVSGPTSVEEGKTITLGATISPSSAMQTVTWSSGNTSIATVSSSGVVTAISPGVATIRATSTENGIYGTLSVTVFRVMPAAVIISGAADVEKTGTLQLSATVTAASPYQAYPIAQNVIWSSSNTSVATVNQYGIVTGVELGLVTIYAASTIDSSVRGQVTINIKAMSPTSITIEGQGLVSLGGSINLTAVVLPTGASQNVMWSVSNTNLANINQSGVLTANSLNTGSVTVLAISLANTSITATKTIAIGYASPASVTISGGTNVVIGSTLNLTATIAPSTAYQAIRWESNNTSRATVSTTGVVTGIATGVVTIFAYSVAQESIFASVDIYVASSDNTPQELIIEGDSQLIMGISKKYTAYILPTLANQNFVWSISDPSVASIEDNGRVIPIRVGSTTLIGTSLIGGVIGTKQISVVQSRYFELETFENVTVGQESTYDWRWAVEGSGTGTGSASINTTANYVQHGSKSLAVTYNFTTNTGNKEVSVGYGSSSESLYLPKSVTHIGFWCYGDGKNTQLGISYFNGSSVQYANYEPGTVDWLGWRYVEVPVTVTQSGYFTYAIRVMSLGGSPKTSGTLYFDNFNIICSNASDVTTTAVSSVSVTAPLTSIQPGSSMQITATVAPANAINDLTWVSDNPSVIEVSQKGIVTAANSGSAKIYAISNTDGSKFASMTISVIATAPTSIIVRGETTVEIGRTIALSTTVSPVNSTHTVNWYSSDTTKATISNNGIVTGIAEGSVVISAKSTVDETVFGTLTIIVTKTRATNVIVSGTSDTQVGVNIQLYATVYPTLVDQSVVWESSDATIATVNQSGLVRGIAEGVVIITAFSVDNNVVFGTKAITVYNIHPQMVNISGYNEVQIGKTIVLTASITPSVASQSVTWSSSNMTIATVNQSGVVSGITKGLVNIVATSNDNGIAKEFLVVVYDDIDNPYAISIIGQDRIEIGSFVKYTATVLPSGANQEVIWSTSNQDKALPNATTGNILGVSIGEVVIIARSSADNGVVGTKIVEVVNILPKSITITGDTSITIATSKKLSTEILPSDSFNKSVTWSSGDDRIAKVDADGNVYGVSLGTVPITATSVADATVKSSYHVTIVPSQDTDYNKLTLTANSGYGEVYLAHGNNVYATSNTIVSNPYPGYRFIFLTENGKIVSYSTRYNFRVSEDTTYESYFVPMDRYYVLFMDKNQELIDVQYVKAGSNAISPTNIPQKPGYSFSGWSRAFTNVNQNLIVTPQYTVNRTDTYTVEVVGGTYTGIAKFDSVVTVTATSSNFSYWTRNGEIASYNKSYSFTVYGNERLVANDTVITKDTIVNINNNILNLNEDQFVTVGSYYLPLTANFVEAGVLLYQGDSITSLTFDTVGVMKIRATKFSSNNEFAIIVNDVDDKALWKACTYVSYVENEIVKQAYSALATYQSELSDLEKLNAVMAALPNHITNNYTFPDTYGVTWSYQTGQDTSLFNLVTGTYTGRSFAVANRIIVGTLGEDTATKTINFGMLASGEVGKFYHDASQYVEESAWQGWTLTKGTNVLFLINKVVEIEGSGAINIMSIMAVTGNIQWHSAGSYIVNKGTNSVNFVLSQATNDTTSSPVRLGVVVASNGTIKQIVTNLSATITLAEGEGLWTAKYLDRASLGFGNESDFSTATSLVLKQLR